MSMLRADEAADTLQIFKESVQVSAVWSFCWLAFSSCLAFAASLLSLWTFFSVLETAVLASASSVFKALISLEISSRSSLYVDKAPSCRQMQ